MANTTRAPAPMDLSKVLAKSADGWVALSAEERRVIASAAHPQQALNKAKGERDPILMWAPKEHSAYIV